MHACMPVAATAAKRRARNLHALHPPTRPPTHPPAHPPHLLIGKVVVVVLQPAGMIRKVVSKLCVKLVPTVKVRKVGGWAGRQAGERIWSRCSVAVQEQCMWAGS